MAGTIQVCAFFLDGMCFGVDVRRVQEVIRHQAATAVPLAPPVVSGLINLRGQIVTALDLRRRLGMSDRPADRAPMNVVVRGADAVHSLLVDEVGEVVNVDEDSWEAPPATLDSRVRGLITGTHKLRDRLLLVLDVEGATRLECGGKEGADG